MSSKYEFKLIQLENLEIVDDNPNEMTKEQMEHLRKTIKDRGFMQPLTITPKEGTPGKFIVIDGAHRLEIFKELKRATIPCYIVPDKNNVDIKIDMVNLNKIKGEFNPNKYAKLLESLDHDIGKEKLKELLSLEEEELKKYLALAKGEINDLKVAKKEVTFTVKDIKCPKCGYQAQKADFKIKDESKKE